MPETKYHPENNPRFVWCIGAIREEFPDIPGHVIMGCDVVLYDRKLRSAVLSLHPPYCQAFCLEHKDRGTPFSDIEAWLNGLSKRALESEGIPA